MSLESYLWPRLVVLGSKASALEAARALDNNQIGTIIVQDRRRVGGIVTDRDLAIRVLGQQRDPRTTTLAEVMTPNVATLPSDASTDDAIRLMQERGVRRIPLVDGERVVGIVTLDDLLVDEAVTSEQLAGIVSVQIGAGGPAAPTRLQERAAQRRRSRAAGAYGRLINQIRENVQLESADQAEKALAVVLSALVRRLTRDEADDLIAQLPSLLQERLRGLPAGPDKTITRATIEAELTAQLGLDGARAAEILGDVGRTLNQTVSSGQMDDVRGQLPKELRNVFESDTSHAELRSSR
jgi:CBS domain-containing protein/uncharacterized protein (DUF2267 family)